MATNNIPVSSVHSLESFEADELERQENLRTITKLKKLQRSVIDKLQDIMDGDEVEAKIVQACSAAANLLKQNGIAVDPARVAPKNPLDDLVDDIDALPTRANR